MCIKIPATKSAWPKAIFVQIRNIKYTIMIVNINHRYLDVVAIA